MYDQNAFLGLQKGAWFNFFLTFFFPFKVTFLATKSLQCEQLGTAHLIFVMGGGVGGYAIAKKKTCRRNLRERRIVHKKARVKQYPSKLCVLIGFVYVRYFKIKGNIDLLNLASFI